MSFLAIASMRCRSSSMIFSALPAIGVFLLGGETRRRIFAAKTKHASLITRKGNLLLPEALGRSPRAPDQIVDGDQLFRRRRQRQEWHSTLARWVGSAA